MIATRTIPARAAFLPIVLLAMALILMGASSAHAGEWLERSCSYNNEYLGTEGWQPAALEGYGEEPKAYCESVPEGGGLNVYATPDTDDSAFSGQRWTYKPPAGSTIARGTLATRLRTRNGSSMVVSTVAGGPVAQTCEYPGCEEYVGNVAVPADATEVYVQASCLPVNEGPTLPFVCHMPESVSNKWNKYEEGGDSVFSAEAGISSAEFLLTTKTIPKASGLTGTLTGETLNGVGTLSFTATAGGPGVYQARVKIDGTTVWSQTPNENEGKCVPVTITSGVRVFDAYQPCPTEAAVHAEIHTAPLADGSHSVEVEVEDAAGDVSTVYTGALVIENPTSTPISTAPISVAPIVSTSSSPERGPCNGTPCDETAKLTATAGEVKTFARALGRSTVTLKGRLTSTTGAAISGAQVKLLQQIVGSAAVTQIASTTTSANGSWSLKAPAGASRLLQVAFYSHTLDNVPASSLDFHENVQGAVSMHAPHRARLGRALVFSGRLAGGYVPAGGESVQMEIFYGGRWRTIEVLPTNSAGRWSYKYVFTLGVGTSYLFRAVTVPNGAYPYMSTHSKPVSVTVVR